MKPQIPLEILYKQHQGFPIHELNEAVVRLQEEHLQLQQRLLDLYGVASAIGWDEDVTNWIGSLRDLKHKVLVFTKELHAHSTWEEEMLFPMIAWYFGEPLEQFTLMEQEHEIAEQYILAFLAAAERMFQIVPRAEAKQMASYLLQAYGILHLHFHKEEEIIAALTDRTNAIGF